MIINRTITKFDYKIVGRTKDKKISSVKLFIDYNNKDSDIIKFKISGFIEISIDESLENIRIYNFHQYEEDRQLELLKYYCRAYTNLNYKVTKINKYYFSRYVEEFLLEIKNEDKDYEETFNRFCRYSLYDEDEYDNIKKEFRNFITTQERKNKLLQLNTLYKS